MFSDMRGRQVAGQFISVRISASITPHAYARPTAVAGTSHAARLHGTKVPSVIKSAQPKRECHQAMSSVCTTTAPGIAWIRVQRLRPLQAWANLRCQGAAGQNVRLGFPAVAG
jgi:hypothetical protein